MKLKSCGISNSACAIDLLRLVASVGISLTLHEKMPQQNFTYDKDLTGNESARLLSDNIDVRPVRFSVSVDVSSGAKFRT